MGGDEYCWYHDPAVSDADGSPIVNLLDISSLLDPDHLERDCAQRPFFPDTLYNATASNSITPLAEDSHDSVPSNIMPGQRDPVIRMKETNKESTVCYGMVSRYLIVMRIYGGLTDLNA